MTSNSSLRRLGLALVLVLITGAGLLVAPTASWAQDRATLIQMGNAQRKAGDDLGALGFFLRAHAMAATPESSAKIGMCEFALNRFVDAEIHLTEAVKAADDPWIRKNRVPLSQYISSTKSMLGWIEVVGTPAGAEVEVGGRPVGRLPLQGRVRVATGEVNVRMDAPGYRINRQDVEVTSDEVKRVNLDLVPLGPNEVVKEQTRSGESTARRRAPTQRIQVDGDVASGSGPGTPTVPASANSPYRTAGWITAGGAVVLMGAGLGAVLIKESNTQDFNDYMKDTPKRCNEGIKGNGGSTCSTLLDRRNTAKAIAIGAFAGAALAAIVSVILLSANPSEDVAVQTAPGHGATLARSSSPQLLCAPSLSQLGGACSMTF